MLSSSSFLWIYSIRLRIGKFFDVFLLFLLSLGASSSSEPASSAYSSEASLFGLSSCFIFRWVS